MMLDRTDYESNPSYRCGYDDGYDDGYAQGCKRTFDRLLSVVINMFDERLNGKLDTGEAPAPEVTE